MIGISSYNKTIYIKNTHNKGFVQQRYLLIEIDVLYIYITEIFTIKDM